jgi:peptide/nickel transport system permease protein
MLGIKSGKAVVEKQGSLEQQSPRQIAWRRLKRNKVAMAGGCVALFFIVLAFGAPLFTAIFHVNPTALYPNGLDGSGIPKGSFNGISWHHPLGLEQGAGRDLFALLLYGARISFTFAIITSFVYVGLGMILGIISALFGGWIDMVLGRIADFLLAFPLVFLFIALSGPLTLIVSNSGFAQGNGARVIIMISFLTIFTWPGFYRVIRSQVLTLREKEFVLAARSLGASNTRIIFREILPNLWPTAIVYLTISLPAYLATEAAYSFLGVGIQAPAATVGLVLNDAINYWQRDSFYLIIPAAMIIIIVLSLNLFGDGLRDALDSRSDR